jgi:hypothetical protein
MTMGTDSNHLLDEEGNTQVSAPCGSSVVMSLDVSAVSASCLKGWVHTLICRDCENPAGLDTLCSFLLAP